MQSATKVGVLVVAFAALLYGAYAILGRALFAKPHVRYYADFEDATGVVKGTQVLMAGLKVGTVEDAKLLTPKLARVAMDLDPEVKIPVGSQAVVPGSFISFGQAPIMLDVPEGPAKGYLDPGTVLRGRRASALEEMVPGAKDTVAELTKTIKATRELIEDQGLRKDIRTLLATSNDTLKKFGALSTQTQGLVAENRVLISQALQSASAAMRDVREGTQMVVGAMKKGRFEERTALLLDRLNSASIKAEHLVSSLDQFVSDTNTQGTLKNTLQNAEKISESGTRIAESTEQIAKNGIEVSAKAVEIAGKANDLADEAKKTLTDIRGFFGKGSRPRPLGITGTMDVMRQTDPEYWRTDVEFSTKFKDTGYHLGVWDAFESNKLIIQLGRDAGKGLYYRYGIYAAKPGLGVDYRLNDRLQLRGDLFDLNDPRLDLRMRINLGKGLYGWVGADRILDRARPTVGIGFQK
ncbi:MAG: phospholipid/cholesterol/gamma-HCH transport system substrate-binding protein [Fimbriimonadaceae bacterium]|jgi:phospholipid/cholesterol/gamma-HCH transport system substrate-binding protein|nr:phospholipid/cholesterol/gamma-HCH transport system substrate-binding protein [Fimbriimonadaceae bacterium]